MPFLEDDPTQDVASSNKSEETNISSGAVLSDPALRSLLTHGASLRSSLDRDVICFEIELSVLLGRVCRVVTRMQSEETFNLFNTQYYLPAWTTHLSSALHRIMNHQSSLQNLPSEVISGILYIYIHIFLISGVIKQPVITYSEK